MGAGEIITAPFYHKDGVQCAFFLIEIVPGSIIDVFDEATSGAEILQKGKEIIKNLVPWRFDVFENAELADNNFLRGSLTAVVRKPVLQLGASAILEMGDTVILNDPIVGQGGNNAIKMADAYARSILEHGTAAFDAHWMDKTFEAFWDYSKYVNHFSDIFLLPPAPHVAEILGEAS
ncbi:hypothetical protein SAMN05443550_101636 [Pedobacter hartonius]|uniref:Styrene monooxygenase StyA putative substrate binding domain-containing protein n=2 Tax=Pedobacter hartonius TaxID=425514 RepID=A0A1H3XLI6_9SPHI|nr:hypothetical protein SAMN05443550_101636 [Pedobacter hartonius]